MSTSFENADRLFRAGQYRLLLEEHGSPRRELAVSLTAEHRILLAHTLLQTGEVRRAVDMVEREIALNPPPALRSECEVIKGLACRHNAEVAKALHHYQLAVQFAKQSQDLGRLAWASVQRFRLIAELHPSDELTPLLTEVRQIAIKAADPHALAYMHYAVALMEASNGRTHEARRHLKLSTSLLERYPNAWLEQLTLIAAFFLDFLECDYRAALMHVERSKALLRITGSRERTLIECNEAHVLLVTGRLKAATERFRAVIESDEGLARLGAIDGLARVHLCAGQLDDCEAALNAHDALLGSDEYLAAAFTGRWTAATRVRLLLKKGSFEVAAATADQCIQHVETLKDRLLAAELTCLRSEALASLGQIGEAARALTIMDHRAATKPVGQLASYYHARGAVIRSTDARVCREMISRARRIWDEEGNKAAVAEDGNSLDEVRNEGTRRSANRLALTTTSALAAAIMLAHKPRLLAQELERAISILECSPRVQLVEARAAATIATSDRHCVVPLGTDKGLAWSLVCDVPQDPASSFALADVVRIGAAAVAIQQQAEEQRSRAALWPAAPIEEEAGALFTGDEMQRLLDAVRRVAATNVSILITGETGTGKEVLARTVHGYSNRAKAPFLPFNCTSTPRDMLDSQLFGHRRGAFTGATENFSGVIRAAGGGTLFLDEIGDMPLDVQPKLLRFLESGEVHPIGETQPVRVDVRIVAATNANLDALVGDGRFREDLFYRLNIVRLHLPPLRERRMEIPALAHHFLEKYAREYAKGELRLAEETMEYLLLYRWPGNIRQLANEIRRMAALCESSAVLMPEHLSPEIAASRRTVPASERLIDPMEVVVRLDQPLAAAMEHLERAMLHYALRQCSGRIEETATRLGVSRKGLYLKRQRFGIEPPESTPAPGRS